MANTKITSNVIADGAITESKLASGVGGVAGIVSSADATAITIDSSENVGIGVSPSFKLHISGTSGSNILRVQDTGNNAGIGIGADSTDGAEINYGGVDTLRFVNVSTERLRIDSSGNIGVGTASPFGTTSNRTVLSVNGTSSATLNIGTGGSQRAYLFTDGSSATVATVGAIPLKLGVNDSEKARITSNGFLHVNGTTSENLHKFTNTLAGEWVTTFYNTSSNPYGVAIGYSGAAPNNSTNKLLQMGDTSTARAIFYSNGGLANYQSNNSNLSDIREKKNIVDADAAWDDVKAWEIKKFHYNEESDSDPKRLGVIAQDLETNNPELISNFQKQSAADEVLWTEEDELPEGVSVGDVKTAAVEEIMRKGVKEQQMYWVAIKALQEALTKIEQLESRIETLEG